MDRTERLFVLLDGKPFPIAIADADLGELKLRLARIRWPDEIPGSGWTYCLDLAWAKAMAEYLNNIAHWSTFDRGGHFAATDAPDLLIGDIRDFFRPVRP